MKWLISSLLFLPFLACGQINMTNLPNATGIGLGDRVLGLTNTTHTALLTVSNLLSLGGGGAQVWTNDNLVVHLVPTNTDSLKVQRTYGDQIWQQLEVDLGTNIATSYVRVNKSGDTSHHKSVVDVTGSGTPMDPFYFFTLGTLNETEVYVLDPSVSGFMAEGSVTAYRFDTYYNVANGQLIAAWGNHGTNKTTVSWDGAVTANGGVASLKNNMGAPASISVTASPFNWTNTAAVNVQVFLDANGATDTVAMNGTTIFTSLASADHTVILQPGEWLTVTYSVATPIMKWKEF